MAQTHLEDALSALTKTLENDRLVKVKFRLGDVTVITLRVQQALLRCMAPKLAIAEGSSDEHHPSATPSSPTVYLGCNTLLPCKVLLHWGIEGCLPRLDTDANEAMSLLVQSWIFGEKHGSAGFQDAVMLRLLRLLETETPTADLLATVFADSAPGSNLCLLMVEELALLLRDRELTVQELKTSPNVEKSFTELVAALLDVEEIDCSGRLGDEE